MRDDGVRYKCNRCGKEQFFPWKPLHDYEDPDSASNWLTVNKDIHFCPECSKEYGVLLNHFILKLI